VTVNQSLEDEATSEVNQMMEDLSYDCKYTDEKKKEIKEKSPFNLLTPIIIEDQRLMGLIDTGSDISIIDYSEPSYLYI
jgi:hypothetical protein